jgi:putative membrane protein
MSVAHMVSKDRATLLAEERTDLAIKRTLIAAENTLMAWIRTAISLIGFGFTIYKFFQYVPEENVGKIPRLHAPRNLGLTLIALGTLALAGAAFQHQHFLKMLGAPRSSRMWSLSFVAAIAVVLVGILAFYGVLLRRGPF